MTSTNWACVGVVAIGRNEGTRLRGCFDSLPKEIAAVVYVDSGSTDASVELARSRGYEVVALDMTRPFTAARARNAGFSQLLARFPEIAYVQFVDGDCAIADGWLATAAAALDADNSVAAVWGRRRELHPERSAYNRMCDVEWAQEPAGDTQVFGGDVLLRVSAVHELGGYDPRIIAGEDPEFAFRLHQRGHRIVRLPVEMTLHDAAITRFSQWWMRAKRSGARTSDARPVVVVAVGLSAACRAHRARRGAAWAAEPRCTFLGAALRRCELSASARHPQLSRRAVARQRSDHHRIQNVAVPVELTSATDEPAPGGRR